MVPSVLTTGVPDWCWPPKELQPSNPPNCGPSIVSVRRVPATGGCPSMVSRIHVAPSIEATTGVGSVIASTTAASDCGAALVPVQATPTVMRRTMASSTDGPWSNTQRISRDPVIWTNSTSSVFLFSAGIPATAAFTSYNDMCPILPEAAGDPVLTTLEIAGSTFAGVGFHGRSSAHEFTIRPDGFALPTRAQLARNPTRCQ